MDAIQHVNIYNHWLRAAGPSGQRLTSPQDDQVCHESETQELRQERNAIKDLFGSPKSSGGRYTNLYTSVGHGSKQNPSKN